MFRAIFICSGNLCRSPMGQFLFQHHARAAGISAMALSMGTLNIHATAPPRHVIDVMDEIGIDVRSHRSQGLQRRLLEMADGVYCMEEHHRQAVLGAAPGARKHVVLLGDHDPDSRAPIADPMGHDRETFLRCRDRIDRACAALVATLASP